MRLARTLVLTIGVAVALAGASWAQDGGSCWHNGEKVPHGTRVGGSECQNGTWVK